jgi:hypothetical protein
MNSIHSGTQVFTADAVWTVVAYVYALIVGAILTHITVDFMWDLVKHEVALEEPSTILSSPGILTRYKWQGDMLGVCERGLYLASLQMGHPEFIAVWLGIKTVATSRRWTDEPRLRGRAIYNIFLIGTALSLAYAAVGAVMTYWLAGPSWVRVPGFALAAGLLLPLANLGALWFLRRTRRHLRHEIRETASPAIHERLFKIIDRH